MKERPILFSGPMVRAIIEGRKTQTRRIFRFRKPTDHLLAAMPNGEILTRCPYGQPGDRLWVRETWAPHADEEQTFANYDIKTRGIGGPCSIEEGHVRPEIFYRADGGDPFINNWRPSIHMPRWASRLTLEVTGVRVERLQDISEEDALAEGINRIHTRDGDYFHATQTEPHPKNWIDPVYALQDLWDSINAERASWASNPWVFVVGFSVAGVRR